MKQESDYDEAQMQILHGTSTPKLVCSVLMSVKLCSASDPCSMNFACNGGAPAPPRLQPARKILTSKSHGDGSWTGAAVSTMQGLASSVGRAHGP